MLCFIKYMLDYKAYNYIFQVKRLLSVYPYIQERWSFFMQRREYTRSDILNNQFYQLPKFLFTEEFKGLSNDAKVLYALIKDRHSLSIQNGWVDEDDHVYLIFSREAIMEMLDVSNKTAVKVMAELKKFDLLREKRQGQGKPNLIYLTVPTLVNTKKCKNYTSKDVKNTPLEVNKIHANKTENNKTYNNKTENQSVSLEETKIKKTDRQTDELQNVNLILQEQIHIDELKLNHDTDLVSEIELNIIEMYLQDRTTIKGDKKPKAVIQSVISKLNYWHIEDVIYKFKNISQTTIIKNNKAYLQTLIYNAPFETMANLKNNLGYHMGM